MTPDVLDPPKPPAPPELPPGAQMPGPPEWGDENAAMRCPICSEDWPMAPILWDYASVEDFLAAVFPPPARITCPVCKGAIHYADNLNPMPIEEALSKKRHADFERYYERERGTPLD